MKLSSRSVFFLVLILISLVYISSIISSTSHIENLSDQKLSLNLVYGGDELFDQDEDGLAYDDSVIDFSFVSSNEFENMCTLIDIENLESKLATSICQGDGSCCGYLGFETISTNWDDIFYLYKGRFGAGNNNVVSAKLFAIEEYFEDGVAFTDVKSSNWSQLEAKFRKKINIELYTNYSNVVENSVIGNYPEFEIRIELDDKYLANVPINIYRDDFYIGSVETNELGSAFFIYNDSELTPGQYILNFTINSSEKIHKAYNYTNLIILNSKRNILSSNKENYDLNERPKFEFGTILSKNQELSVASVEEESFRVTVQNAKKDFIQVKSSISQKENGIYEIEIIPSRQTRPGKYKFNLDYISNGKVESYSLDFSWGVLALNTNKSEYFQNEDALIGIGVLDDFGDIICNADIVMQVVAPDGSVANFRTSDNTIKTSEECEYLGVTEFPDYYATYKTRNIGEYNVFVTATTKNGVRTLNDKFYVNPSMDYSVARSGPTRIYPPVIYHMNFTIYPQKNYVGKIREYVPVSFDILPSEKYSVVTNENNKSIEWDVDLIRGREITLDYQFDAPDISPYLFTLGKLEIGEYSERRYWYIASDRIAAGNNEQDLLMAQDCNLQDQTAAESFNDACGGIYPSICLAGQDQLSCNDGAVETITGIGNNDWAGANITAFNSTINKCRSIDSVRICYEWYESTSVGYDTCNAGVDNDGDLSYTSVAITCPTTATNALGCADVTALEGGWTCEDFFNINSAQAWGYIDAQRVNGAPNDLNIDRLYFNVSYTEDVTPPVRAIISPLNNANLSQTFLINASINDTGTVVFANLTIYNTTTNVTSPLALSLGAGSASNGYWDLVFDSTQLNDGLYNMSVYTGDDLNNFGTSANISVTIDNTDPNASIISPINNSNLTNPFSVTVSLNDSLSGIHIISLRAINPNGETAWQTPTLSSGNRFEGIWSTNFDISLLEFGDYNVTINATDYSGNNIIYNLTSVKVDNSEPNASINVPTQNTNISSDFVINSTVNDSISHVNYVDFRLINTQNNLDWVVANLSTGDRTIGSWNYTYPISLVSDGFYNLSIRSSDYSGNILLSNITNIAIDRIAPNISVLIPSNNTNFSQSFNINISVNDSISKIYNFSLRIINDEFESEWFYSEVYEGVNFVTLWNKTIDVQIIVDGYYNITVNSSDYANNFAIANQTEFALDRQFPNVSIVVPLNGTVINGTRLINSSVNDSITGVQSVRFRLINETTESVWFDAILTSQNIRTGFWTHLFDTLVVGNGFYNLTINATDYTGNALLQNISQVLVSNDLDFQAPNTSIVFPSNLSNISSIFSVVASINDTDGSLQYANFSIYNSSGNVTGFIPMSLLSGTITTGSWNATFDSNSLVDGLYNLSVVGVDGAANLNYSNNISITIDNTLPNTSVIIPINFTEFIDEIININSSNNDSLTGIKSVSYRIINPSYTTNWLNAERYFGSIFESLWNYSTNSTLIENGFYNITANVTDYAGNSRIVNISQIEIDNFVPDTIPPNISVLLPTQNKNVSGSILIYAAINDTGGDLAGNVEYVNLTFYNVSTNVTGFEPMILDSGTTILGFWSRIFNTQTLSDGNYYFRINATDDSGNTNISENQNIVVDNTDPTFSLISPELNTNVSLSFIINGSVNDTLTGVYNVTYRLISQDDTTGWLRSNRTVGSSSAGYWNTSIDIFSVINGKYNITINASDYAGNQYLSNYTEVTIDTVAPNVSSILPVSGDNVSSDLFLNSSLNDSTSSVEQVYYRFIRNGFSSSWIEASLGSGSNLEGTWNITYDTNQLSDGAYNISINASDYSKNQLLENITSVNVDNTAPVSIIVEPTNNTFQNDVTLFNTSGTDAGSGVRNVAFRLYSQDGLTITNWFQASRETGDIFSGYYNASFNVSTIINGIYNVTVNITDYAGFSSIRNLSYIRIADTSSVIVSAADYCAGGGCGSPVDITSQVLTDNDASTQSLDGKNGDLARISAWTYSPIIGVDDVIEGVTANCNFATSDNNFHVHYDWCDNSIAGDCSTDGSVNWNTNFCQSAAQPTDTSCDLYLAGVDTVSEVNNLWLRCVGEDDDASGADLGTLDFVGLTISYQALTDLIIPNATIIVPRNFANISGSFVVNASINDTRAVDDVNLTIYNETTNVTGLIGMYRTSGIVTGGFWSATYDSTLLPDGYYNLSVNASDRTGNFNITENVTIVIDNTIPTVGIINPLNNSNISDSFAILSSANDTFTGVRNLSYILGSLIFPAQLSTGSIQSGTWLINYDSNLLADGFYNLTANYTDYAGNQNFLNISSFAVDNTNPNVSLIIPNAGSNFSEIFSINVTANDSVSQVYNVSYRLINSEIESSWIETESYQGTKLVGFWNRSINPQDYNEGIYNVTVNVTDYAQNQILQNITTVILDPVFPNSTIQSPLNYTNISGLFEIIANVNDSTSEIFNVSFRVVGINLETNWLYSDLLSGDRSIGFWNSSYDSNLLSGGAYNITINATDYAGNQLIQNLTNVVIDNTESNSSIIIPNSGYNFSSEFSINVSVNDSVSGIENVSVRLINPNNQLSWFEATNYSGTIFEGAYNFTPDISSLEDGYYNISVNATDYAKNQNILNVSQILIDRQAGNISIINIVNVTNTSIDFQINASANDSLSGTEFVNFRLVNDNEESGWFSANIYLGEITEGFWNTTIDISTISDGVYNLTGNITDFAGNQRLSNVSVVVADRLAPNVSQISPTNLSTVNSLININSSSNDSISRVQYVSYRLIGPSEQTSWSSATLNSGSRLSGAWNLTFDTQSLSDGNYNITINASDYSGNSIVVNISSIFVLNTPPNVSIITPLNGSNISNNFVVNASVNDTSLVSSVMYKLYNSTTNASDWFNASLNSGNTDQGYWNVTINSSNFFDGNYNITINATSLLGVEQILNITSILIDNSAPTINLNFSVNEYNTTNTTLNFTWNTDDIYSTYMYCNLSINYAQNVTNVISFDEQTVNASVSGLNEGLNNWSVTCLDFAGNVNTSELRNFTIVSSPLNLRSYVANDNTSTVLNWSDVDYADSYAIYISTDHKTYGSAPNITGITDSNWTDLEADLNTKRFYRVATIRGSANKSTDVAVGRHRSVLYPGWNFVSWPFELNTFWLKNSTSQNYDLPLQPANCVSQIWSYNNSLTDGFELTERTDGYWLAATGDENFTKLEKDKGYWLYNELSENCNITYSGVVPYENSSVNLNADFNAIAWNSEDNPELPDNCESQYPFFVNPQSSAEKLFYYNQTTSTFKGTMHFTAVGFCPDDDWGWFPDSRSSEFLELNPTRGYYLETSQALIWTVDKSR